MVATLNAIVAFISQSMVRTTVGKAKIQQQAQLGKLAGCLLATLYRPARMPVTINEEEMQW